MSFKLKTTFIINLRLLFLTPGFVLLFKIHREIIVNIFPVPLLVWHENELVFKFYLWAGTVENAEKKRI